MKIILVSLSMILASYVLSQDTSTEKEVLSKEAAINLATYFLPEKEKNEAKVMAYSGNSELIVLRDSDSYLTCVADDPNKKGVQIVCYYSQLEDFMTRGRELKSQGVSPIEVRGIRKTEIENGDLFFPKGQSMMYIMSGKSENLNVETGELKDGKLRYVIYIPYATQESTGLPLSPSAPGMPWIMDAGTHRAHIMVTPL